MRNTPGSTRTVERFSNDGAAREQEYDGEDRGIMRTILSVILLLAAAPAWADLVQVTETADTVYYLDSASINDKADFRRVSVIQDYAKQETGGTRSRRVSYEIDCARERLTKRCGDGILRADGAGEECEFVGNRIGVAVRHAENGEQHPVAHAVQADSKVRLLPVGGSGRPPKGLGVTQPAPPGLPHAHEWPSYRTAGPLSLPA